ncbi:hypothetical protein DITRI_Ditri13aG0165800 [Diplodiscus trichospermus]
MTLGMDVRVIMTNGVDTEEEATLRGQAQIFQYLDNFVESMALRCVVELGVADALNSHPHGRDHPMTLSQIAARIPFPTLNIDHLSRVMRFLSSKKVFDATTDKESGEIMYGLNNSSKWLLTKSESEVSLVPLVLLATNPCALASWNCLSACIAEGGGCAFSRANGSTLYDFQSKNYEYKKVFSEAMACNSRVVMKAVLKYYKDGFKNVGSIVDVGGGSGAAVAKIVKAHPHIKGFNFDLPYVVASAPEYPNVTNVGGDMFAAVPHADAIFLKWILHNWSDEKCVQILKNCRKALPEMKGKVIIVDAILDPQGDSLFDMEALRYDLKMLVMTPSGKERTEDEWKKLLKEGGFSQYKIIKIPSFLSIIEAYLD